MELSAWQGCGDASLISPPSFAMAELICGEGNDLRFTLFGDD